MEIPIIDLTTIVLLVLAISGVLYTVSGIFDFETDRGIQGEKRVARKLRRLHGKKYIILNDLFF